MPVIDQINEASDRLFDAAETTNERAHEAARKMVSRLQDSEMADRMPKMQLPLADRLPEPMEAVDAYFEFIANGIETNRSLTERVINRFSDTAASPAVKTAPAKKATTAKSTAKKAPAKKATAKKTTARKAPTKKTTTKK